MTTHDTQPAIVAATDELGRAPRRVRVGEPVETEALQSPSIAPLLRERIRGCGRGKRRVKLGVEACDLREIGIEATQQTDARDGARLMQRCER